MEKAYAVWREFQERILGRFAALLLLGCTLLALLEVIRRYVFGVSFEWQADAVTFFILSGVFLYFAIAQRRGDHLNVILLLEVLGAMGPRARHAVAVIRIVVLAISFFFMLAVVWWGVPEVRESIHYESRTESLAFPMWPFLLALLIGFAFMAVTMFFQFYREVQQLRGRTVLVDPPEEEVKLH